MQTLILAQLSLTSSTRTDLYTAPSGRKTWLSSIKAVNQDTSSTTYTFSIAAGGAAYDAKQVWCSQEPIPPNAPAMVSVGAYLSPGDVVRVQLPGGGNVSFHALGR